MKKFRLARSDIPFFISLLIIFIPLTIGVLRCWNVPPSIAEQTQGEVNEVRGDITWQYIFINNSLIVLLSFIPFFGTGYMAIVQYRTGLILGNLSRAIGVQPLLYQFLVVVNLSGLLEYIAYIFVATESLLLVYHLLFPNLIGNKLEPVFFELKTRAWKKLLFSFSCLLLSSFIESYIIHTVF